jgi:hypothetical protein
MEVAVMSRFQAVFVALMLVLVSSYCAMECTVAPCHDKAVQPPCHQHQQPKQDDASQNCLHSQLVMDTAATASVSFDLVPLAILPTEPILFPVFEPTHSASERQVRPPLSIQHDRSTILRV